jgi:hypothetical protein
VFQNGVLKKIFGPKREEVTTDMARMREIHACNLFVRKPERKIPFGRPRRRWNSSFKIHFREIGSENVGWIRLA